MKYKFYMIPEKKDREKHNHREIMDICCIIEKEIRKKTEKSIKKWFE